MENAFLRSAIRTVSRAVQMPPEELIGRASQAFRVYVDRRNVNHGEIREDRAIRMLHAHAAGRSCRLFPGLDDASATVRALRVYVPSDYDRVAAASERLVRGEIPIFGLGYVSVGAPPRWNREPIAGIEAPLDKHWSQINYLDRAIVGDHKVLWEFNRHQYLVTLAQSWRYDQNPRWLEAIREHISTWIDENPPGRSVNWSSSLEVAYRAISWCLCIRLLGADKAGHATIGSQFAVPLVSALQAHGRHIERHLSTWFSPNTHLTGEALGLLYIGMCFPELPDAARWLGTAVRVLTRQSQVQILPDGVYFEQATQYHRYTSEIYLHFVWLSELNQIPLPDNVRDRTRRAFEVLSTITRGDGTFPLFGDDDGGRLIQLDGDRPHQSHDLLSAAALYFGESSWLPKRTEAAPGAIWLHGHQAAKEMDRLALLREDSSRRQHVCFEHGGIVVMREGVEMADGHLVFDAGPHGALSSGHAHADALAVELYVGGAPLFVDAGTLSYDGAVRNRLRSTNAHNTVAIDGQGSSEPSTPFAWKSRVDGCLIGHLTSDLVAWSAGKHSGFERLDAALVHRRDVLHLTTGCWAISDLVRESAAKSISLRWHLSKVAQVTSLQSCGNIHVVQVSREGFANATLVIVSSIAGTITVDPVVVSEQYGQSSESHVIAFHGAGANRSTVQSIVVDWSRFADTSLRVQSAQSAVQFDARGLIDVSSAESAPCIFADCEIRDRNLAVSARIGFATGHAGTRNCSVFAIGARAISDSRSGLSAEGDEDTFVEARLLSNIWQPAISTISHLER